MSFSPQSESLVPRKRRRDWSSYSLPDVDCFVIRLILPYMTWREKLMHLTQLFRSFPPLIDTNFRCDHLRIARWEPLPAVLSISLPHCNTSRVHSLLYTPRLLPFSFSQLQRLSLCHLQSVNDFDRSFPLLCPETATTVSRFPRLRCLELCIRESGHLLHRLFPSPAAYPLLEHLHLRPAVQEYGERSPITASRRCGL
jgi:hypothetical protein